MTRSTRIIFRKADHNNSDEALKYDGQPIQAVDVVDDHTTECLMSDGWWIIVEPDEIVRETVLVSEEPLEFDEFE